MNVIFAFISNNIVWTAPIISIILSIIIKLSSKPDKVRFNIVDYCDFGFELSFTTMLILLSQGELPSLIYITWFALLIVVSLIVRYVGWNEEGKKNYWGIIIPDVFGVVSLIFAIFFSNGGKTL